ncbi:MAG: aminotransferase class V-fold PLP-dependent enzyme [Oscillospiraceae bacterium]|nr:aminotransferase class V-fold PLP-dependent enzyme [Oscillospiraceae bacterium]
MSGVVYFDNAATTLCKPKAVPEGVRRSILHCASPGRGGHAPAMAAAEVVYRCRKAAAELFKADDPEKIVFTSSATHGLNIAINSLVRPGTRVAISGYEHNAVTRPLHAIGADVRVAAGRLFNGEEVVENFRKELENGAKVVILNHVSNVFGFIQPAEEVARLCKKYGAAMILDASQSAGSVDIDAGGMGCAFIALPGHKGLYGPQGPGILICGAEPKPLIFGGTGSESKSQDMPPYLPDALEAGTANVPGIAGLLEGINYVNQTTPAAIMAHQRKITRHIGEKLQEIGGFRVYLARKSENQAGVLSVVKEGTDSEETAQILGEMGFAVRAGMHCAPLAHRTAGTLDTGTVRISPSSFNTLRQADMLIKALSRL